VPGVGRCVTAGPRSVVRVVVVDRPRRKPLSEDRSIITITVTTSVCVLGGVLLLCLAVGVQSESPDDRLCTLRVVDDVPGEEVDLVLQEGHTPLKTVGSHLPVGFLL
jgi:hypothetical protein